MQEDNNQEQPGAVITPGAQILPQPAPVASTPVAPQPVASPVPAAAQPTPTPVETQPEPVAPLPQPAQFTPVESQQPAPEEVNFYRPGPQAQNMSPQNSQADGVSWTASEYISNPKNAGWFMMLALLAIVLCTVTYLITHDLVSTVAIGIFGVIVGIFAARKPHVLDYQVDSYGIQIGPKHYSYNDFKAFSIADEHAMSYVSLLPLKRFMTPIIIHYAPDDEETIVNTLADYLPYEDHKLDLVENLSRRVRF